ncbi:glycosyltransferase family 39 protein, partial [archaeon]|nr:glycosyltransferase family 39 protein [archaeon]
MKLKINILVLLIFLVTLGTHLFFSFQTPNFYGDESYLNLRILDNILETGQPMSYDELSYGGRPMLNPQFFHYFLALFSFIPFYLKIIPSILISSLVIIVYLISYEITKNKTSSLIASLLSGFVPIYITQTLNQISIYSLLLPLSFLMILSLIKIEEKKYFMIFIIISFLLPLISYLAFFVLLAMVFYLILSNVENNKISKIKKESIFFSFLLMLFLTFIFYKKAFFLYGINFIWQNVPSQLFFTYFRPVNILEIMYLIGLIPLILGAIGIYLGLFKQKRDPIILLTSFIMATSLFLVFRIVDLYPGLLFLSTSFIIISSLTICNSIKYLKLTKLSKLTKYLISLFLILIILISIFPSFISAQNIQKPDAVIEKFKIFQEIEEDATILTPIKIGHLTTYITQRKNFMDSNFLLAPDPEQRIKDHELLYSTLLQTKGLELTDKYSIDYIYFP